MTRLMCSHNRTEVELVRKELFQAGIRAEIRSNPLAEALRVTRLELWVEDERDLFNASKLYAEMQARGGGRNAQRMRTAQSDAPRDYIEVADPDEAADGRTRPGGASADLGRGNESCSGELEQASSLLEKDIEEMLVRESELADTCASLRSKMNELSEALTQAQAELARETERRTASESKQAAEVAGLQSALERERTERARAAEQVEHDVHELQQQLKSRDGALNEAQKALDAKGQQLQSQQAAVVELRKEIVSHELQREEYEKSLSRARAGEVSEREARVAAEERAERAVTAQKSLEKQLAAQKDLQQQVQACAASLNSLRSKLQAKRGPKLEPDR